LQNGIFTVHLVERRRDDDTSSVRVLPRHRHPFKRQWRAR
jgi:hypothetical protein